MENVKPLVSLVVPSRTYVLEDPSETDIERLEGSVRGLEELGFEVVRTPGPWRNWKRFGGTDQERLAEFMTALSDPDADLVLPVRGGYGMTRILPGIDWKRVAERNPVAMGFSDFTAFNMALFARTGLSSWQGPMAGGLAPGHTTRSSQRSFLRALTASDWSLDWVQPGDPVAFEAAGTIWGGNLAMIVSLLGTPWFPKPEMIRGGLLFLEDVGEAPYRIDRMLTQLEQAGVFDLQSAVVLGQFTDCGENGARGDFTLGDALDGLAGRLARKGIGCVRGLPFGHVRELGAVPFGVPGRLQALPSGSARLSSSSTPVIFRGRAELEARLAELSSPHFED